MLAAAALLGALAASTADAQVANRDILLVVPHAAGTGVDAVARRFAPDLQKALSANIVVENRAGASGAIGSASVARAKADGTTLMLNANPPFVTFPYTQSPAIYDAVKDFTPVARIGTVPMVLVVSAASSIASFDQWVEYARRNPDKATYASPGGGSAGYLAMERLNGLKGLKMEEILYKSTPQSLVDVASGQVLSAFSSLPAVTSLIETGKLRALAIGSGQRIAQLPDVPTLAEATGDREFFALVWYGFLAPAGTPPAITARLFDSVSSAFGSKALQDSMRVLGIIPELQSPDEFQRSLARDQAAAREAFKVKQ